MLTVLGYLNPDKDSSRTQVFVRQLGFWSVFVLVISAPTILLARITEMDGGGGGNHIAMFCGIVTLILLFTWLTSRPAWRRLQGQNFVKALTYALLCRAGLALLSTVVLALATLPRFPSLTQDFFFLIAPDMASALLGMLVMGYILGTTPLLTATFFSTYILTIFTGIIALLMVGVLSVFVWGGMLLWAKIQRLRMEVK